MIDSPFANVDIWLTGEAMTISLVVMVVGVIPVSVKTMVITVGVAVVVIGA